MSAPELPSWTPPTSPRLLNWEPEVGRDDTATPCGGEYMRGSVLLTTPRQPSNQHFSTDTYPETDDMKKMLQQHNAQVTELIKNLMLRQEHAITLLNAGLNSNIGRELSFLNAATSPMDTNDNISAAETSPRAVPETKWDEQIEEMSKSMSENKRESTQSHDAMSDDKKLSTQFHDFMSKVTAFRSFEVDQPEERTRLSLISSMLVKLRERSAMAHLKDLMASQQRIFQNVVQSQVYEGAMTLIIVLHFLFIIWETDSDAICDDLAQGCGSSWLFDANIILQVIYTLDSFAVINAYRWKVLAKKVEMLEMFVVFAGYVDLILEVVVGRALPNGQVLKLFRLTRLLRAAKLLRTFPELYVITHGFVAAMRSMMWGFILLILLLSGLSIASVQMLHDTNKQVNHDSEYCVAVFDSVWNAMIMYFQTTVAGDSWGTCSIPIMKDNPTIFILFASAVISIQVGFLNLIMSVIIDRVAAARASDTEQKLKEQQKEIKTRQKKWANAFKTLDEDGNSELSVAEVIDGLEKLPSFKDDLELIGIQAEDFANLLYILDRDHSGTISLQEFLSTLELVWNPNDRIHQVTTRMQLKVFAEHMKTHLTKISRKVNVIQKGMTSNMLSTLSR